MDQTPDEEVSMEEVVEVLGIIRRELDWLWGIGVFLVVMVILLLFG